MDPAFLDEAAQAYASYGWLGALGVVLTFAVGLYKLPAIQNMLPERARWASLHPRAQMGLVLLFSLSGFGLHLSCRHQAGPTNCCPTTRQHRLPTTPLSETHRPRPREK